MRKVALLDGDIILYRAAVKSKSVAQMAPMCDPNVDMSLHNFVYLTSALQFIDETVQAWMSKYWCRNSIICLSSRYCSNFRKLIYQHYKAQRPEKPFGYWKLYEYCTNYYTVISRNFLESDDIMGILVTSAGYSKFVLVSIDKDLDTLPGLHLNLDKMDGVYIISQLKADSFWRFQTLVGDSTDNYPGCPRVGKVRAARWLDMEDSWDTVFNVFGKAGQTRNEAIMQARIARILRDGDVRLKSSPGDALAIRLWNPDGGEWIKV